MDRASALEQLHTEIKQILENYENSLLQYSGRAYKIYGDIEAPNDDLKIYINYAIMVYRNALYLTEQLMQLGNKK